jgi:hypothetical protein
VRIRWYVLSAALVWLASTPQSARSSLVISYMGRDAYGDPGLVRVTLGEGRKARHIKGRTFESGEDSAFGYQATPHFGPIRVGTRGELPVRVVLVDSSGDTLASVRAAVRLQPSYDFAITIVAGYEQRLQSVCKVETHAVPIRAGSEGIPPDSMFVAISGLPAGAVC